MNNDELIHYGVLGMKWGTRRASGAGPRVGITKKRTIDMARQDLQKLKSGKDHLSYGIGKKRQKRYDERDQERLKEIIDNPEKINNGKMFVNKLLSKL